MNDSTTPRQKPERNPRLTAQDFDKIAHKRNFVWLGIAPVKTSELTTWRCNQGHIFEANISNMADDRTKTFCPQCSSAYRTKTANDYHTLAKRRNFLWVGDNVPTYVKIKTQWQCSLGHTFEANFNNVNSGKGCPECRLQTMRETQYARRIPIEKYIEFANANGFELVDTVVYGIDYKVQWKCPFSHTWQKSFYDMQEQPYCPQCNRRYQPKSLQDYIELGKRFELTLIGEIPSRTIYKATWRCKVGHNFDLDFDHLNGKRSNGCPECNGFINGARVSNPQLEIAAMVDGEVNYPYGIYSLDIAIQFRGIPICIEYDGWFYHKDRIDKDKVRDAYLTSQGWRVLRVRSTNSIPSQTELYASLDRLINGSMYEEIIMSDWKE